MGGALFNFSVIFQRALGLPLTTQLLILSFELQSSCKQVTLMASAALRGELNVQEALILLSSGDGGVYSRHDGCELLKKRELKNATAF